MCKQVDNWENIVDNFFINIKVKFVEVDVLIDGVKYLFFIGVGNSFIEDFE